MSEDDKYGVIVRLQERVRDRDQQLIKRQEKIDELIRENTRLKNKNKSYKCPICLNGEKMPEQFEQKI